MVRTDKFSPLERVATEIAYFLKSIKVEFVSLTFDFEGIDGRFEYVNDPLRENQGFGTDEEVHYRFLTKKSFSGHFLINRRSTAGVLEQEQRSFICHNVIRCSEPYVTPGELNKNVFIGTRTYAAPEAQDAVGFKDVANNLRLDDSRTLVRDARPFGQYMILESGDQDHDYVLLGPSWHVHESVLFGYYTVDGVEYELSLDKEFTDKYGFNVNMEQPKPLPISENKGWTVYVREGTYVQKFVMGSFPALFNGASWDGHSLLTLLKLIVFTELSENADAIPRSELYWADFDSHVMTFDIEHGGARIYLTSALLKFASMWVEDNDWVASIMKRYGVADRLITISNSEGVYAYLTKARIDQAETFACSFAYLLSEGSGAVDFFQALNASMDANLFEVTNGSLVGKTSSIPNSGVKLDIQTPISRRLITLQRVTLTPDSITDVSNGWFIMGYRSDDESYRYVVVSRQDEHLFLVYDPVQTNQSLARTTCLDSLLDAPDCNLILFRDADSHQDGSLWAWTK